MNRFQDLIFEPSGPPQDPDQVLGYALYLYLRSLPEIQIGMDDWKMLQIILEKDNLIRAVGIMYVLPNDELPVELELSRKEKTIDYKIRIGCSDDRWRALTESKKWKAVYSYAVDGQKENWNWSTEILGSEK